ncbi:hypothetical protein BUALT_Bualt11G0045600 [Buddleja alternifolia]|uniref:Zinc finger PMZ-type domain-containing protein n=1 Tax=Buddleja alternifolia TaxID=168488 RepID=A0AAV6X3D9_9LAMI|nr:hypothetical protein BUALT_Bualt11G0045600 [Buddleja alternifolia]
MNGPGDINVDESINVPENINENINVEKHINVGGDHEGGVGCDSEGDEDKSDTSSISDCHSWIPIIGLDGCFVKGIFKGQLLFAVGRDGNDNIYPIAMAYVEVKKFETWDCFLNLLLRDIGSQREKGWAFISDRYLETHIVFLRDRHCSCGMFQLVGYPYFHAIAACNYHRLEAEDFVDDYLKKDTYLRVYRHMINPVPGMHEFEESSLGSIYPPHVKIRAGRPKTKRIKDANDTNPSVVSRRGFTHICGICGEIGQNRVGCPLRPGAPEDCTQSTPQHPPPPKSTQSSSFNPQQPQSAPQVLPQSEVPPQSVPQFATESGEVLPQSTTESVEMAPQSVPEDHDFIEVEVPPEYYQEGSRENVTSMVREVVDSYKLKNTSDGATSMATTTSATPSMKKNASSSMQRTASSHQTSRLKNLLHIPMYFDVEQGIEPSEDMMDELRPGPLRVQVKGSIAALQIQVAELLKGMNVLMVVDANAAAAVASYATVVQLNASNLYHPHLGAIASTDVGITAPIPALQTFDGTDPLKWLARMKQHFNIHPFTDALKFQVVMVAMDGATLHCHAGATKGYGAVSGNLAAILKFVTGESYHRTTTAIGSPCPTCRDRTTAASA